jgi:hypothetical protein
MRTVSTSPSPNSTSTSSLRSDVPLGLHGGSGIPVDQVQKAIGLGVAKMNVGTAIHVAFKEGTEEGLAANPGSQRLPGPYARRPTPARRPHHVRRTRCLTTVNLTPGPLIGGVRRRTIPHRTSRDTARSVLPARLCFTCRPPLAPQPKSVARLDSGFERCAARFRRSPSCDSPLASGSGAARGQSMVSPKPWARHQARMAANLGNS